MAKKELNFNLVPEGTSIKFAEHFCSLEGEGDAVGQPSLYLRLAGCFSAACTFCDTKFSWSVNRHSMELGAEKISKELAENLRVARPRRMTITGGEPLHYCEHFGDIYQWANSLSPQKLDFLGIESNGNLLHKKSNVIALIKSFNNIRRVYDIDPTLTVSPKLDAKTCYEDQLSQTDVDQMYFEVFNNINDYLFNFNIRYKFVYDFTNEFIDIDHLMIFISYLVDELHVEREHIMLMPFTPADPTGKDLDFWNKSMDATAKKSMELGIKYSPRIHIDRKLD